MSHSPFGIDPLDVFVAHREAKEARRQAFVQAASLEARSPSDESEMPQRWPRQGIAAALVVDRNGREHIEAVIVVDFYRSAIDADQ